VRALVYLVGEPGSGKSSVMRAFTEGRSPEERPGPPAHTRWTGDGADGLPPLFTELGRRRDNFSGTDALPMNIQPAAVAWLAAQDEGLVVAEGDRLGNARFLAAAEAYGWSTMLAWMDTPADVAAARRDARGGGQNPTWVKGRRTKVARLVEGWMGEGAALPGTGTPEAAAHELRERVAAWWH